MVALLEASERGFRTSGVNKDHGKAWWYSGLAGSKAQWKCYGKRGQTISVCKWSEVGKRVLYNPPWMHDAPKDSERKKFLPSILDFAKLSPFGGSEWYAPRSAMTCSGRSK
jgi:hypothetical protein